MGSDRQGVSIESERGAPRWRTSSEGARSSSSITSCSATEPGSPTSAGDAPDAPWSPITSMVSSPHLNGRDITSFVRQSPRCGSSRTTSGKWAGDPVGFRRSGATSLRLRRRLHRGAAEKRRRLQLPACRRARAAEGGYERLRASGRRCPPHLLNLRPWRRGLDGDLPVPRPRPVGQERGRARVPPGRGGVATTSTTSAEPSRGCRWRTGNGRSYDACLPSEPPQQAFRSCAPGCTTSPASTAP